MTTLAVLQNAIVSVTARFTVTGAAFTLLRKIGTLAAVPRPMPSVSRPNEMSAGPVVLTVITAAFETMLPAAAVMLVVPLATPVTTPVLAFTVATVGDD